MRIRALVLLVAVSACGTVEDEPVVVMPAPDIVCTMEARPGITVQPLDRQTGEVPIGPTMLILRDGIYADTVRATTGPLPAPTSLSGAYERTGVYTVTVRHRGYRDFVKTGVIVTKDPCHVNTVRLTAPLEPMRQY